MKSLYFFWLGVVLVGLSACQPALVEEPTTEIIRGTSRPNAIDKDSFETERRVGGLREWTGGARTASSREALRLRYKVTGNALEGEYALGSVGVLSFGYLGFGKLVGTLTDGILELNLTMENGCQYSVFGSATEDRIQAFAEPLNCDVEPQEWELGRS